MQLFVTSLIKYSLIIFLCLITFSGCTTYRTTPVDSVSANSNIIQVGKVIYIKTKDQKEFEFQVTNITDTHVRGTNHNIAKDDIEIILRKDFSPLKTYGAVNGVVVAGALIMGIGFLLGL